MIVGKENVQMKGQQDQSSAVNSDDKTTNASFAAECMTEIRLLRDAVEALGKTVGEVTASVDDSEYRIQELADELDETKELALELMEEVEEHSPDGFDIQALASHLVETGETRALIEDLSETVDCLDNEVSEIKQQLSYFQGRMDERNEDNGDGQAIYDLNTRLKYLELRMKDYDNAVNAAVPVLLEVMDSLVAVIPKMHLAMKVTEEQLCFVRKNDELPF